MDVNNEIGFVLNCLESIRKGLESDRCGIATGFIHDNDPVYTISAKILTIYITFYKKLVNGQMDEIRYRMFIVREPYSTEGYYVEMTKINSLNSNASCSSRPYIYIAKTELDDIIALIEDKTGTHLFDMLD